MYVNRANIGGVFGASYEVSIEISKIVPIFLVSLPFVAITRIATAGFYATEKVDCHTFLYSLNQY